MSCIEKSADPSDCRVSHTSWKDYRNEGMLPIRTRMRQNVSRSRPPLTRFRGLDMLLKRDRHRAIEEEAGDAYRAESAPIRQQLRGHHSRLRTRRSPGFRLRVDW